MLQQNALKFVAVLAISVASAIAQSPTPSPTPASSSNPDETQWGGFNVHQTVELGYRFTRLTGSPQTYDTFIDQHQGLRLMDQTLSMRSPTQVGSLFDDLTLSSSGWGGDPENVARARVTKYHVYDFTAMFRRDQNYFDYNLLANPLNFPATSRGISVNSSPHAMYIRRRMYDFGLTLLPDSKFTVRLGYSRNRSEGPSFSSFHEGTDVLLNQAWNVQSNEFRIGFDVKALPHLTISYDQFLAYDRNDTDYTLAPFATFPLSNGTPVELGLPWNTAGGSPCAAPFTGAFVNPACNGYFSYLRNQRVRTSTPTEQLTLKANMKRLNLVGRVSYSASDLHSPFFESFNGLVTRTREVAFTFSGPATVRRIATTADLDATYDITHSVRLSDSFRFDRWNIPATWDSADSSTVGLTASLLSAPGATTLGADFIANFLGQKSYTNTIQLELSATRHFGVHVGYRLRNRHVFKAEPETIDPEGTFEGFEGDSIDINEHTALAGIWIRPTTALRINLDGEATYADNFITRISPRQQQRYRARIDYRPNRWASFGANANDWEARNGESDTRSRQHYRNAGFVLTLTPDRWADLDLAYNYTNTAQNAYICYNGSLIAPGTTVSGCPTFDATNNPNPNWIYSTYSNRVHFVSGALTLKPIKKFKVNLGYGLTRSDGTETLLNPAQPYGSLEFTYHQPFGSLSYELVKNVSLNGYWNHDEYNEDSFVGPTLPRYFRDNRTVLSLKYEF